MPLRSHKTKIVATIGPATADPAVMERLIRAGMSVARLNFSHGDFKSHGAVIKNLRKAAKAVGQEVAIMADLPGPKMRIGELVEEPIELKADDTFTLTTEKILGNRHRASVTFSRLPRIVKPGNELFLNDGLIKLVVKRVHKTDVHCRIVSGGELRSRKGLNLPGIKLGMSAFTPRDRKCLKFALQNGVDAVSQSFVDSAKDIHAVRKAARKLGFDPFIIAKIERSGALDNLDKIMDAADGIMVARGDLGVETPMERMAILQKDLIHRAMRLGKPVITATQMLESMTTNRQPTRAEATDVANAILDGTDCVMLSGESAMGKYPVVAVSTLAKIAAATEPYRQRHALWEEIQSHRDRDTGVQDLISLSVETVLKHGTAAAVIVPSRTGGTARSIARFKLPVWIAALSADTGVCRKLMFSYGIKPIPVKATESKWGAYSRNWVKENGLKEKLLVLIQGPSPRNPERNHVMELIELD